MQLLIVMSMREICKMKNPNVDIYSKIMSFGKATGCHQRQDRSFHVKGYQFPVCARCTGVLVGYLITIPLLTLFDLRYWHCLIGCGVMFIDWFIQYKKIKESSNFRRLVTGCFGGVGIFGLEIMILIDLLQAFNIL